MRPLRRAPLRCDITLLTPLFFFVYTRDILQEKLREKKKRNTTNASTAIITTTAVLLVQLRLHIQQHFFHISILSTDLILVGEWQLLQDYKLKG